MHPRSLGFRAAIALALIVSSLPLPGSRCAEAAAQSPPGVLLGVFPDKPFTDPTALQSLAAIDAWTAAAGGARTSLGGMFIDLEQAYPEFNVFQQLELAWQAGYTPLVKLGESRADRTAAAIANGIADAGIHGWARAYASWMALGGSRIAFLAPLPEANYRYSAPYTADPANFKKAFRRIQEIFADEGVPRFAARWVFAPNGYTEPPDPEWEQYYPGDAVVDVVGFSQFNQGYCYGSPYDFWLDPTTTPPADNLFAKYIARMKTLAPNRPLFILQTATTAQSPQMGSYDDARKNQWLENTYGYFADQGVAGVVYFNFDSPCDYKFFTAGGKAYTGYREAAKDPLYEYTAPAKLAKRTPSSPTACVASPTALCLQGGRFRVEVPWLDSNTGELTSAYTVQQASADSGLFRFWDPNNWEILVKVLDGCGANGNGKFWVFAAAATDRAFTLVVTDTATGLSRRYSNAQGTRAAPILDIDAFDTCGAGAAAEAAAQEPSAVFDEASAPHGADVTNPASLAAEAPAAANCQENPTTFCLQGGRFRTQVNWRGAPAAAPAPASASTARTSDSGIFTFYGPANWEVMVKVLNGCGGNGNGYYWVFAAAATDREFDIVVTDTATGQTWTGHNDFGSVPPAFADIFAFATCG